MGNDKEHSFSYYISTSLIEIVKYSIKNPYHNTCHCQGFWIFVQKSTLNRHKTYLQDIFLR